MIEAANQFCSGENWEAPTYDVRGKKMIRFVTKCPITTRDVNKLVKFLVNHDDFKEKIYHVHTGAHCTSEGKIGTA